MFHVKQDTVVSRETLRKGLMDILEQLQERHSVRTYTEENIPEADLTKILQAGLLSPTSRGKKPWEFIVIQERETLNRLAFAKGNKPNMLKDAKAAIIVIADETVSDVWIEDVSIAMMNMHLEADSLGIGSCWIQLRKRNAYDGQDAVEYVKKVLALPEKYQLNSILSLGMPKAKASRTELNALDKTKIHYGIF